MAIYATRRILSFCEKSMKPRKTDTLALPPGAVVPRNGGDPHRLRSGAGLEGTRHLSKITPADGAWRITRRPATFRAVSSSPAEAEETQIPGGGAKVSKNSPFLRIVFRRCNTRGLVKWSLRLHCDRYHAAAAQGNRQQHFAHPGRRSSATKKTRIAKVAGEPFDCV